MCKLVCLVWLVACSAAVAGAQLLTGPPLVKSLQPGGHVIVMRHASSPREVPPVPNPDNVPPERQLDEKGRATATAMGEALQRLKIPIGEVLTSPTYRARETARLVRLPNPRPVAELGEGTGSMQAVSKRADRVAAEESEGAPARHEHRARHARAQHDGRVSRVPRHRGRRGARVWARRQGRRACRGTHQDRGVGQALAARFSDAAET